MECLPVKFGAGPPKINHFALPATFGDRSDSGKTLNILGGLIARAIRAKEGQQPRGQRRSGAGQMAEKMGLGMIVEHLFDAALVMVDDRIERLDYLKMHQA